MQTIIVYHPSKRGTDLGDTTGMGQGEISDLLDKLNKNTVKALQIGFPECKIESAPGNGRGDFETVADDPTVENRLRKAILEVIGRALQRTMDAWAAG